MSFDRVAGIYRGLETIVYGGALQRARLAHLEELGGEPRVLLLGDGDGRFLAALLDRVPGATVEVVEASGRMIRLARRRMREGASVVFHKVHVADFQPSGQFDLVVSHFFLDCFEPEGIREIVGMVRACLSDDGDWLISDFQMPESGRLRRMRASFLLWVMYRFFGVMARLEARELVNPDPILQAAGFSLSERRVSNFGFLRADRWQPVGQAPVG